MASDEVMSELTAVKEEVAKLHAVLEKKGINSQGTTDAFGRTFSLPVDAEHKATSLNLFDFSNPHMRAFHTSWFGFFSSFFSMFAAAPLLVFMKKSTSLSISPAEGGLGNILAVSSNIVMRVVVGYVSDLIGPRRGMAFLLLISSPAILGMMFVTNAAGWIACRTLIGVGLATFVTCQVWNSQMFSKSIVGIANATAAGWGNLGGGVTNLCMPLIMVGMLSATNKNLSGPVREDTAWRLCYIVPLAMHLIGAALVLTGRDLPDGNFKELEAAGAKQKGKTSIITRTGFSNVNAYILTATYGMCFGIELTMNSVAAKQYFSDYHGTTPQLAGLLASLYGLMNLFARSAGGAISDWANRHFGMRGRIWAMWIVQTIEGLLCIALGAITIGMKSPYKAKMIQGMTKIAKDVWVPMNGTMIPECGSDALIPPKAWLAQHNQEDGLYMVLHPPSPFGDGDACIQNQNKLSMCVFVMILFSLCVQAAEGLHYGVVPYVSRPALGIVSGMVGAGGNLGAVISLRAFFFGTMRVDAGLMGMGIMVCLVNLTMFGIYFPDKGGMLFSAGSLGSYDPQLWKPPAEYRGADSVDLSAMKTEEKKTATESAA